MKRARLAALVLAAGALGPSAARAQPSPDRPVGQWIGVALDEIAAHRVDPPHGSRLLATLSVAMQRAVTRSQPDASADAAADGAASTVLAYFFQEDTGRFHGLAERAENAAAGSTFTGIIPVGPEYWVPTPPGYLPPLLPRWGEVLPWNIQD